MEETVILQKLAVFPDVLLGKTWQEAGVKFTAKQTANQLVITVTLPYPAQDYQVELGERLKNYLELAAEVDLQLTCHWQIAAHSGNPSIPALPTIKNIIAVASGKGGVGKSTVAVNLALALAKEGAAVGLLDADIYGPSQPTMLGTAGVKPQIKEKQFIPITRHGIATLSMGNLIDQYAAMVWRGPMIGKALQQLLLETAWPALDYLVVDLPPGTGDIQLTLCQKIPVSGALIVTTPQDVALVDVRRACDMFAKLGTPLLGVVENMSYYHCPHCGDKAMIFGAGGADTLGADLQVPLLAKLPLNARVRELLDAGSPPMLDPDMQEYHKLFLSIARQVAGRLACQRKDYSAKFPKIVVTTDKKEDQK